LAHKVGQGFSDDSSSEAHALKSYLSENEAATVAGYRSRNKDQWSTFMETIKNIYGLTISPFGLSGKQPKTAKRPTPATWVIYK
jgi:hypothetical protein